MPEKPSKLTAALYGGLIMGVISGIPILNYVNCLCCAGILLGGFLSVFFYKNDLSQNMTLTSGDGLALGSLAGVFGGFTSTIVSLLVRTVTGTNVSEKVNEALDRMGNVISPETANMIRSFVGEGGISPIMIALSLAGNLIVSVLFGLLGGLIGFNIFKPKAPMMMPPSPPLPPPAQP